MFAEPVGVAADAPRRCRVSRAARRTSAAGRSRVRGAPEVLGQVPVSCLAEEIATPGEGQIQRAVHRRRQPGAHRRPAATGSTPRSPALDCMISVDNWLNETTRHADVILPGLSALEQPHHDDLIWQFAVGSGGQLLARRSSRPPTTGPQEWEILIRLGRRCASGSACGEVDVAADRRRLLRRARRGARPRRRRRCASGYDDGGPERMLDLTLRTGPFGDRYGEDPDGLTLEQVEGGSRTASTSARSCRGSPRCSQTADGQGRCSRRRTSPPTSRGSRARLERARRGARARQPPPPALEQLVDAQRDGAGEGQGPLHAAHPPRRRARAAASPTASSRAGHAPRRAALEVAGRGHRRDHAGRGVAAPRLGSRQGRHPAVGRQRARRA